ncbi:protein GVQW3-like [Cryptotermes secundus]|uniref:protein GVQW3-like n=1 Tax=Cryptotermes secundus TaxID=105785 RepID=UPI001454B9C3|nr:protein GVQW3-like [Cryptotermes secundus]
MTHFSVGRERITDEERSGRPATSRTEENIAKVRQIGRENCRLTDRSIAEQANMDTETVTKILTEDPDMRKERYKTYGCHRDLIHMHTCIFIKDPPLRTASALGKMVVGGECKYI